MPEVLGDPPSPRTALFWNGTAWQWALVDAAGHLQIDVVTSGLPAGAATAAAQALALAQLQTIAEIRDALQSVATDRLIVRGEDQLFTFKSEVVGHVAQDPTGVGYRELNSGAVPANEVWIITNMMAWDTLSSVSRVTLFKVSGAVPYRLDAMASPEALIGIPRQGWWVLDSGDTLRAGFSDCTATDGIAFDWVGFSMTKET